jgi:hypothetical protein
MSTQPTPGPWRVYFESDAFDSAQSILRIIDPRGDAHPQGPLAIANINVVAHAPHLEEPLANARLIASAPDLLEALETCVSELNQLAFLANDKLANAAIEKGIEAIRKAKGGAK